MSPALVDQIGLDGRLLTARTPGCRSARRTRSCSGRFQGRLCREVRRRRRRALRGPGHPEEAGHPPRQPVAGLQEADPDPEVRGSTSSGRRTADGLTARFVGIYHYGDVDDLRRLRPEHLRPAQGQQLGRARLRRTTCSRRRRSGSSPARTGTATASRACGPTSSRLPARRATRRSTRTSRCSTASTRSSSTARRIEAWPRCRRCTPPTGRTGSRASGRASTSSSGSTRFLREHGLTRLVEFQKDEAQGRVRLRPAFFKDGVARVLRRPQGLQHREARVTGQRRRRHLPLRRGVRPVLVRHLRARDLARRATTATARRSRGTSGGGRSGYAGGARRTTRSPTPGGSRRRCGSSG